ncbi:MAG: serpin family protein, partial [Bacteroidetes bacterium]
MKKTVILSILFTSVLGLGSCQKENEEPSKTDPKPINLDLKSKSLLEADNAFAFDLFRDILQNEEDEENIMVSPLSISLALAMTYNGANGETKEAMENVFHLHGLSVEDINKSYQGLINALLSVDPKVIMEIANSIWYRDTFHIEDDFLSVNKTYYDAEVEGLDFTNPASKDIINQWVSSKTHNKIEKIVDNIDPSDIMFLINAIYFKGTWKYQFENKNTLDSPFYTENGGYLKNVKMMNIKGDFNYLSNDLFQAVELPYGQGNYSMIVMLPQSGVSIDDLVSEMNQDKWKTWMESFYERSDFDVYLPKFKFEYKKELKETLT